MKADEFEATSVLEKLAEHDKVDAFFEAIDADDFAQVKVLLKQSGIDAKTISIVLKKIGDDC